MRLTFSSVPDGRRRTFALSRISAPLRSAVMRYISLSALFAAFLAHAAPDLEAPYAGLKTLSCDVERVSKVPQGELRILSRVFHQAPGKLLVENFSPGRRKILCDGTTLHFHDASFKRGFRQEVAKLDDWWNGQIANLPCTPFEHTRRLRNIEPRLLKEEGGERLFGYAASNAWVEVRVGAKDLIRSIDLYSGPDHAFQFGRVEYTRYDEISGVPVITAMTSWKQVEDLRVEETVTFRNIRVNEPLADRLFDARAHFEGVEFVDEYRKSME